MTYDDLTLALVTSGVANAVMVGLLACAMALIVLQSRRIARLGKQLDRQAELLRNQGRLASDQTAEYSVALQELRTAEAEIHRLMADNDESLAVIKRLADEHYFAVAEIGRLVGEAS